MKNLVIGAVIGAAVAGTIVALTTPKTGVELRGEIKKEAGNVKVSAEEMASKTIEQANGLIHEVVIKVKQEEVVLAEGVIEAAEVKEPVEVKKEEA